MARFRLLVIISAVWLTLIFNLERPDFEFIGLGNIDLDSVAYLVTAAAALALLWLPDLARRTEYTFLPALALYLVLRLTIGNEVSPETLPLVVLEIVVIYLTIALFQRISRALLSFEHTVESVLLRPDEMRVLPMETGIDRIKDELSRARRFEREVGIIMIGLQVEEPAMDGYRFDLEEELQKQYLQLRVAQVAELVLYKIDLVALHKSEVIICMPETSKHIVERKAEELREEITWRLGLQPMIGVSMFPEDGFIFRDLVDRATVRMYEEFDDLALVDEHHVPTDDDNDDGTPTHASVEDDPDTTAPQQSAVPTAPPATEPEPSGNSSPRVVSAVVKPIQSALYPWPDVIQQQKLKERMGYARRQGQEDLHNPNSWLGQLPYQPEVSRRLYVALKRVIDLTLVMLVLPIVFPVMGLVALMIWLEDQGPIFFVQQRTGYGGERFNMFKFRTMVPNAEEKLKELAEQGLAKLNPDGKLAEPLKLKRDPRVTRIGRILRKTSLDELPQLINVLRGDMSLVGPRPTSWDLSSYRLFHTERLQVRPGITGLWQVAARGTTNFDEWVDWDRTYVDKMCLSLDVQIFFRTFTKVFVGKGAR